MKATLKILVVSNLYPPHYLGGYELGCRDAVEELKRRGHEVAVLTSTYGVNRPTTEGGIHRRLAATFGRKQGFLSSRTAALFTEISNRFVATRLLTALRPDVVFFWNPAGISLSIALIAGRLGFPVGFFVFDDWAKNSPSRADAWFNFWSRKSAGVPDWLKQAAKRGAAILGFPPALGGLEGCKFAFATEYLRANARLPGDLAEKAAVIHWGIDLDAFPFRESGPDRPHRLLYVGQVVPHKGVHTAIEALELVRRDPGMKCATLSVVGPAIDPGYLARLKAMARSKGLDEAVHFSGFVDRKALIPIYRGHDILVFPSCWEEPFGIVLLEGMASGLAIAATATGGSAEILRDRSNCLVFPREDARRCADAILELALDRELYQRIRRGASQDVERRFNILRTMDRIEIFLRECLSSDKAGRSRPPGT